MSSEESFHELEILPPSGDLPGRARPGDRRASRGHRVAGFVHDKFLIFGGQQTVWTGSTNLTSYALNAADPDCATFFTCKPTGATCSDGTECCSGTCYHGQTRTCK